MAPTKTDTGHGGLFDIFPERPRAIHGGARFDEGFNLQSKGAPKGASFDEFRPSTEPDGDHGQLWDEWGWKDMPDIHGGLLYDESFASPAANATSRGPLYDLFQPSTQVKFIYDGKDSEGIVDHVDGEDVFVRQRGSANVVPVGLSQFLAFRSPSLDNTATVAERSEAEAPSAWSPDAHGAGREAAEPYGQPVMPTPQGQATQERSGVPEGSMNIVDQLKSMFDPNDVQKTEKDGIKQGAKVSFYHSGAFGHGTLAKPISNQPTGTHHIEVSHWGGMKHGGKAFVPHKEVSEMNIAKTRSLPSELLKSCSEWSGVTSVAKARNPEGYTFRKGSSGAEMLHHYNRKLIGESVKPNKGKPVHIQAYHRPEGFSGPAFHAGSHGSFAAAHSAIVSAHEKYRSDGATGTQVGKVAKEVTVAEAAIQAEEGAAPFSGSKGAGSYCPECRVSVKPSEDGRCPTCQMALKAHEGHKIVPREKGDGNGSAEDSAGKGVAEKTSILDDLRKAFGAGGDPMPGGQTNTLTGKPEQKDSNKGQAKSDPSGPSVPERAHAESDHNEDKSKPKTCPHCGEPLKELDDKTDEGAPSNVEPDVAHKCLEGLMDTFKTCEEPVSSLDSLRELVAA